MSACGLVKSTASNDDQLSNKLTSTVARKLRSFEGSFFHFLKAFSRNSYFINNAIELSVLYGVLPGKAFHNSYSRDLMEPFLQDEPHKRIVKILRLSKYPHRENINEELYHTRAVHLSTQLLSVDPITCHQNIGKDIRL